MCEPVAQILACVTERLAQLVVLVVVVMVPHPFGRQGMVRCIVVLACLTERLAPLVVHVVAV